MANFGARTVNFCVLILTVTASLAVHDAGAFENGRNVLLKNMTACLLNASRCKEVHLLEPAQCIQSNGSAACNVPYVISLPENDAGAENRGKTLLIPIDIISGLEAYRDFDEQKKIYRWLPNYFFYAADFALRHYRGSSNQNWVMAGMNSANARSQDQLHIQICNLGAEAQAAFSNFISQNPAQKTDIWTGGFVYSAKAYKVMKLSKDVRTINPFYYTFLPEGPSGSVDSSLKGSVHLSLLIAPNGTNYLLHSTEGARVRFLLPPSGTACDYR